MTMTRDEMRNRLAVALLTDGHSLRFGPDGYVLDTLLSAVGEIAADELRAAADEAWEDNFKIARSLLRRADALDPSKTP
jgi:hypothetical protein